MRYARDEAARIVEWLLPDIREEESLAVELPFRDVQHRADVAIISPRRLSAIEIKGPRDNLGTLVAQIEAYQEMFLDVAVAVAPKHLMFATSNLPSSIGLILLDRKAVVEIRSARPRKLLQKDFALRWLRSTEISKLVGTAIVREMGIEGARATAIKKFSADDLTNYALQCISARNSPRYRAFLSELGTSRITLDDVQMLALAQRVRR